MTETFGASHFVPFSSFHRYQRADSVWANEWTTPIDEYGRGFKSDRVTLLPAFVRYDCTTDSWEAIDPPPAPAVVFEPEAFDDDWSHTLDRTDVDAARRYFTAIERLAATSRPSRAPRRWARARDRVRRTRHRAVRDLRSSSHFAHAGDRVGDLRRPAHRQLHADDVARRLAELRALPGFHTLGHEVRRQRPRATDAEVRAYFAEYRRRLGLVAWLRGAVEQRAKDTVRARLSADSPVYRRARLAYVWAKGASSR